MALQTKEKEPDSLVREYPDKNTGLQKAGVQQDIQAGVERGLRAFNKML